MFFPRAEPLRLSAGELHGLRVSQSSAPATGEELSEGPARAAVAVHAEANGRPNVTVAVCALRTGEVVFYSYRGELTAGSGLTLAVDAALSFAESMGFRFDDEQESTRYSREEAYARWRELVEATPELEGAGALLADPREAFGGELDLELDLLDDGGAGRSAAFEPEPDPDPELELEIDGPAPREPLAPVAEADVTAPLPDVELELTSLAPALTKFRAPGGPDDAGEAPRRGAALGRLKLVKRRRTRMDGAESNDPLLKLLSLF